MLFAAATEERCMAIAPSDLCDIEEIKQLKARYFRYVDTKQWEKLRTVFTDDVRFEGITPHDPGPDAFIATQSARLAEAKSIHQGHMPEIRIVRPDYARGTWSMFDWVEFPEPATEGPRAGQRGAVGYGYYQEQYRKVDGTWKISFMRLTRQRVEPLFGRGVTYELEPGRIATGGADWLESEGP
jgi:hypothetical protein